MKQILIMRHAKSDWADSSLDDFDRPLNDRGCRDAPEMGKEIHRLNLQPDSVIASPALRAKQTAEAVKKAGGFSCEIHFDPELYHGYVEPVVAALKKLPDSVQRVMIFGHNPTWENLVVKLTGKYRTMPTAAIAVLDFPGTSWNVLDTNSCNLNKILTPKDL